MPDTVAADQLRLFIERIERLSEEKKGLTDDIRDEGRLLVLTRRDARREQA